jgi:CspA family cold shock protein
MANGVIIRLFADRGFGFIKREQKEDLFFHFSALQGARFADLREGLEVEFEEGRGLAGRPQAFRVRLIQPKD